MGVVLFVIGFFIDPTNKTQFYVSYLWAYLFVLGIAVGALAWLMLQYISGGNWGIVIRRPCEAAARTLPLVGLMFIPIVIGMHNLYEWSTPKGRTDPDLVQKHLYLNVPFFLGRCILISAAGRLSGCSLANGRSRKTSRVTMWCTASSPLWRPRA